MKMGNKLFAPWEKEFSDFQNGRELIFQLEIERERLRAKWGGEPRLRLLALPQTRERYDKQVARWHAALTAGSLADLQAEQARMVRALRAIEREAREARVSTDIPPWFEVRLSNGRVLAVALNSADARMVPHRHLTMTLEQICVYLSQHLDAALPLAEALAGARVVETRAVDYQRPFRDDSPADIVG